MRPYRNIGLTYGQTQSQVPSNEKAEDKNEEKVIFPAILKKSLRSNHILVEQEESVSNIHNMLNTIDYGI